jgi:hypothetical protein
MMIHSLLCTPGALLWAKEDGKKALKKKIKKREKKPMIKLKG